MTILAVLILADCALIVLLAVIAYRALVLVGRLKLERDAWEQIARNLYARAFPDAPWITGEALDETLARFGGDSAIAPDVEAWFAG